MTDRQESAKAFSDMHVPGSPLVLFNAWDAGSARAVSAAGAAAIATGSWSVAAAHGYGDGEKLPLDLAIANLARIVDAVDIPVSVDIESGYDDPAATAKQMVAAGAIGCNVEDSFAADGTLREVADQAERVAAMRRVLDAASPGFFINARTDIFFQAPIEDHDGKMVKAALDRAARYTDAGSDGIFVPGVVDLALIEQLVAGTTAPINIMMSDASPSLRQLADVGVARISYGPAPYLAVMRQLEAEAATVIGWKGSQPD